MDIRPIKSDADYTAALSEIEALFDSQPNTPEGERLEVLATLVEAYEEQHFAIPAPDPVEAVHYFMESRGLTRSDLEPYIGSRARVSEVLNRKRPLTLRMIQRLHRELGIPADALLAPPSVRPASARKRPAASQRRRPSAGRAARLAKSWIHWRDLGCRLLSPTLLLSLMASWRASVLPTLTPSRNPRAASPAMPR